MQSQPISSALNLIRSGATGASLAEPKFQGWDPHEPVMRSAYGDLSCWGNPSLIHCVREHSTSSTRTVMNPESRNLLGGPGLRPGSRPSVPRCPWVSAGMTPKQMRCYNDSVTT